MLNTRYEGSTTFMGFQPIYGAHRHYQKFVHKIDSRLIPLTPGFHCENDPPFRAG
ncbi:hypothetical protein CBM2599_B50933 [Cupriavidus taiwanensis]|nr:hypothetical protein CBM2600_B10055 [Cupriavidus taiwanensis]SOY97187.1 hypothetical protein CBM2599_B50933 [Cupriavidus taiwanensis]